MSASAGISLTLENALKDAEKLDAKFNFWVKQSIEIEENMRKAFDAKGGGQMKQYISGLNDLQEVAKSLSDLNLSVNVDSTKVEKMTDALDRISQFINLLDNAGIEIFDTQGLYATTKGLGQASVQFENITAQIRQLKSDYRGLLGMESDKEKDRKKAAAILTRRGLNIANNTEEELKVIAKVERAKIEAELTTEIEREAIAQKELNFAKKTQDEKAQYIKKRIDEILKEEKAYVNNIRREYAQLYRDLKSQQASIGAIEAQKEKGKILTPEMQGEYEALLFLESETKAKMAQIEKDHLEYVSDLRVRYATRDAKEIAKILKTQIVDPQSALDMASNARTGLEMEAAKEAVQGALMTVDKDDLDTISALNKAYIDLRASIEKLTKAQKNEQTLQPTLRNEYARILAEIDKVTEAKTKLEATKAYEEKDKQAIDDYKALEAREADLMRRKAEIRDGNETLLTEIETKHEADRAQKRTEALLRYEKELEDFRAKYGEITSFEAQDVIDSSEDAKNVRQSQKAIEDLKEARAKLSKEDANYDEILEKLNEEIKRHEEHIESVTKAEEYREKQAKKNRETYDGAMDYAKQAKSLNDMKEAMRALEVARNKEEVGTKKYKELDRELSRITKRYNQLTKEVKESHKGIFNIGEQIGRKIALWFSVSQIQGYIHKLMEVRGEFELQQRSLQAILQNKEDADKVWQKTVDLAIKSPFRIKDLVTYTKQLAAYRIESDKLYETNKMLADVSAGLGVDMDRLILAYGQVRSAEYLRGTELRQFTEAGIPMLAELSKLMSELEGRSIGTAEVFEMISKRMITFAEVEEVFKRMTSAGGTFYQMQEKQADTLKGQMSNLKDSIDIMLNDIGQSMEGTLKNAVEAVRRFVENWQDLVDVLNTFPVKAILAIFAQTKLASSGLGKYFYNIAGKIPLVSDGLLGLEISVESLTKKSKLLGKAWGGLLKILGGTATAGIVIGFAFLVKKIAEAYLRTTELTRATQRLNKEWGRIFDEDTSGLEKNIDGYRDLVTRLEEANVGSQERARIMSRLNNEYGEYLDFVVDEATSIEQLANSYDLVVKRMKEKASLNTYEKGAQAIEDEYTTALKYAKEEFYNLFEGMSIKKRDSSFGGIIPTTEDIDNIYALVQQKIQELGSEEMDSLAEQQKLIQEIVSGYYGEEFYLSRDYADAIELMNVLAQKKEKELELQKEIDARYKETLKSREANLAYQKLENKYKEDQRKINEKERGIDDEALRAFEVNKELEALRQQFEINKIQLQFDFGSISEQEMNEQKDKIVNWATDTTRSINEQIKSNLGDSFSELDLSRVLITRDKQEKGIAEYVKNITDGWEQQNKTIAEQISLKSQGKAIDEKILEKALRMEVLYRNVANLIGVELDYTERLSEESRNAINALLPEDYQISLEQAYSGTDAILANLKAKETEHLNVIEQLNEQKKNGLPIDEERLRLAEESYKWTKKTQDLLDPKAKTPIKEQRVSEINAKLDEDYRLDVIDQMKDEVTLLQEANTERQKAVAWQAQMVAMQAKGATFTQDEVDAAEKAVEQTLLRWQLLGGTEEEKEPIKSPDQLLDERIKVVDDMNRAYKDLNETISKTEALEGAFAKYKDAFQKAYAGTSLLPKGFGKMTASEFIEEFNFTTEEGMVDFFDKLIKYAKKTSEKVDVELAKGEYIMETRLELKKDEDKKLLDEVQGLFDQYELSAELKRLNIPKDLAKSLFDVDYLDLEGLKKAVEDQKDAFVGKDMLDEYEDLMKKIGELSRKRQEDEAKEFINFLKKNLDEIKLIQDKGAYNIALADRLFGKGKITAEQYMSSIRQIVEKTNKETSRVSLENFKESPKYIQAMGDMTAYTAGEVRELIKELEQVVAANSSAFSADEANAYIDAIYNAQEKLDELEQSPFRWETFANISEILETDKAINEQKEERDRLQEQKKTQLEELIRLEEKLKKLQEEKNAILSGEGDLKSKANRLAPVQSDIDATTQAIKTGQQAVSAIQSQAKTTETILGRLGDKMKGLTGEGGGAASTLAIIDAIINGINDTVQGILEITNEIGLVMESFGKETDMSTGFGKFQKGFAIFAESSQHAADGWNALKNGDPVGAVVSVVKSVTSLIRGINEYKDAKLQVEIDKQVKEVERLGKAYEKLEAATESAYSIQQLQQYNEELERNVELQIASYKAMIAAEQAKKNTDDEQIAAWNEELEALTQQWEDLKASMLEGVGGVSKDNYRSRTREFVDAWVSAFQETGNGLDGLKNNFREFFDNIIAEQAAMRVTETFLEPFYKSLDEALKGYELTVQESKDLREMVEKIAPDLSSALEKIWGQLGGSGVAEAGGLSALQKGVQSVSEETAQVIEALLNSMRFTQAETYQQVKEQTGYIKDIRSALRNITKNGMATTLEVRVVD